MDDQFFRDNADGIAMPLQIPAFDQYQQPMVPLRGLWNRPPEPEGDRYVNAEVDWLVTTKSSAVQFQLAGNSPVSLSQIVALCVDNSRCGADVQFIFPDSGFALTVPAHEQIITPVFTNALMFYASAPNAAAGDITVLQILNSMPPPIPIPGAKSQNSATQSGVSLANGVTQVLPASVSGTLNTIALVLGTTAAGACNIVLLDGTGKQVWGGSFQFPAAVQTLPVNVSGLSIRFQKGLSININSSTATGTLVGNFYYTTP